MIHQDSTINVIQNILQFINGNCYILQNRFMKVKNLFDLPCASLSLDVFLCLSMSSDLAFTEHDEDSIQCFRMPFWPSKLFVIHRFNDLCIPLEWQLIIIHVNMLRDL